MLGGADDCVASRMVGCFNRVCCCGSGDGRPMTDDAEDGVTVGEGSTGSCLMEVGVRVMSGLTRRSGSKSVGKV